MSGEPFRVLPRVTPATEHFWRGGAEGELRFLRCDVCGAWIHPPGPNCPACLSRDLSVTAAQGTGTVVSYTVNVKPWNPTMPDRYVIAFVETDEGVRLLTNVVDCDPDDVHIGQRVEVRFEQHDEVWLPLFVPVGTTAGAST